MKKPIPKVLSPEMVGTVLAELGIEIAKLLADTYEFEATENPAFKTLLMTCVHVGISGMKATGCPPIVAIGTMEELLCNQYPEIAMAKSTMMRNSIQASPTFGNVGFVPKQKHELN